MTLKEALLLCPTWSVSALGPSFSLWIALSINTPGRMQSVQFMSSGELTVLWVPKTGSAPNLLSLCSEARQPLCRPLELVPWLQKDDAPLHSPSMPFLGAPLHASVPAPPNRDPRKAAAEEAWPPEWTEGPERLHPGGCLLVRSEHVCVPLVLFGNDLLELQNLVSLYISALTFAVF